MTLHLKHTLRWCGIAARHGGRVACPEGGCRLAVELGMAPDPAGLRPCPVEAFALRPPDCPLVAATLEALRRTLEAGPPSPVAGRT